MKLPTLYKLSTVGKHQQWTIETKDNSMVTTWGQVNGAMQVTTDTIKEGKNIGKSNETTASKQAELEAKSKWDNKKKRNYVESLKDAKEGKVDTSVILGGINPMLAKRFDEDGDKIVYPAYVQPKFDGTRCIAIVDNGECTLWSRTRKQIHSMPHIVEAVEALGIDDIILDGELYADSHKDNFEELIHFIRQSEPINGAEVVQYHIYDTINKETYQNRYLTLAGLKDTINDIVIPFYVHVGITPLIIVQTDLVNNEDELFLVFNELIKQGYEGAMVRNAEGLYVNKRSRDLQKIKEFQDAEFKIVNIKEGRGKLTGCAIFECDAGNGKLFDVKMVGAQENLKQYFTDPSKAIGRWLTVKFQNYTKYNIPRFPVGLRFKEDV